MPDHAGLHDEHRPGPLGPDQGRPAAALAGRFALGRAGDVRLSGPPALVRQRDPDGQRADARRRHREARRGAKIYYHSGLDIGGAEGLVDVIAATAGLVVSRGQRHACPVTKTRPVDPRYDVVYLLDDRGWYYRYSHLQSFDPAIKPGATVAMGQKIGVLGKEGGSGGWSHLHFEIVEPPAVGPVGHRRRAMRSSGRPPCASSSPRSSPSPGRTTWPGPANRSRSTARAPGAASGTIARYDWTFSDGTTASGPEVERAYDRAGEYSEILKVTDDRGNVAYDFAVVQVLDRDDPDPLPPGDPRRVRPDAWDLHPGDPITFKVRTFGTTDGNETWDFGDGTPPVEVQSDGNVDEHAPDGYASPSTASQAGRLPVRVERTDGRGRKATGRLFVQIQPAAK